MGLHKLNEWLIPVGMVVEKLSDKTEFKRYRWHEMAATREQRVMLPRAAPKGFFGVSF